MAIRRRELIAATVGSALVRVLGAKAQPAPKMPTIGAVMSVAENDPDTKARMAAFRAGLAALGWVEGKTVRIEYRWAAGDVSLVDRYVSEIVAQKPDVILANGTPVVLALKKATTTIPIVCALVIDPVGLGLVASLARPGGNITGFTFINPELIGKWQELLSEAAPATRQARLLFDPQLNPEYFRFLQAIPPAPHGFADVVPSTAETMDQVRATLAAMAQSGHTGLIIGPDALMVVHIKEIASLARDLKLPSISVYRQFAVEGGLISYGPDLPDIFRRSAGYIDRILKGGKPADLPVQQPDKFELVINIKTAATLGLAFPQILLATADDVIE